MARLGRPPKSDLYGGHIRKAENFLADHLPEYIDNLHRLAFGVWYEETTKDGPRRVYQAPPDFQTNVYLINRIMGKPTDRGQFQSDDLDDTDAYDQHGNAVEP
jgi:hypothetical protein